MSYMANETSPVAAVALLLQLGCPEENLSDALLYLSGRPIPGGIKPMLAEAREAIKWAAVMAIPDE